MINEDKILHLASLSKINLTDDEVESFKKEFKKIVKELDAIQRVDTSKATDQVQPTKDYEELREDVVGKSLSQEDVLKNSKSSKHGMVSVPKVVN